MDSVQGPQSASQSSRPPPTTTAAPKHASSSASTKTAGLANPAVAKPKQSKSRNGCITCKAKRLKCDETKPSCQQCHKRSVTCGGYKKDFKWRTFEETSFTPKVTPPPPRPKRSNSMSPPKPQNLQSPSNSDGSSDAPADGDTHSSMNQMHFNSNASSSAPLQMQDMTYESSSFQDNPFHGTTQYSYQQQHHSFHPNPTLSGLDSIFEDPHVLPPLINRPSSSGQSPKLIDLLLPGSPLNAPQPNRDPMPDPGSNDQTHLHSDIMHDPILDEDIEEIIRQPASDDEMWLSTGSDWSPNSVLRPGARSPDINFESTFYKMYIQPQVQAGSPEMLMLRYDKQTCGILSVKDGPTENPWRTLIWPLARDSPALYHAIASMTAFHASREKPNLRVDGIEHMRRSIRSLATGIENMRTDTAIATTLVLAFSESWDQHISTGIEHLRGARILVNRALTKHSRTPLRGDDLARLKFLCNSWVYMDVIARLTSIDDDDTDDVESIVSSVNVPFGNNVAEIDPLMGCATTLFPIIGRVADLCRKVRKTDTNSIAVISQAIELKQQIEQWEVTTAFEPPEDPSADVLHALQTAEAYRYATLLYLHQAVPEIPSLTSAQLAKKVLVFLATVPLSSRLVIVQIYPLLAAGCEAYEKEDRMWVEDRWTAMTQRMWIGNIDKCLVVTKEVWRRRDASSVMQEAAKMSQRSSPTLMYAETLKRKYEDDVEDVMSYSDMLNGNGSSGAKRHQSFRVSSLQPPSMGQDRRRTSEAIIEALDPELTVRGSLHWVGVMKDWDWEILLG